MTLAALEATAATLARLRQTISQLHAASLMATGEQRQLLEAELAPLNASAERLYRVLDGREVADAH